MFPFDLILTALTFVTYLIYSTALMSLHSQPLPMQKRLLFGLNRRGIFSTHKGFHSPVTHGDKVVFSGVEESERHGLTNTEEVKIRILCFPFLLLLWKERKDGVKRSASS